MVFEKHDLSHNFSVLGMPLNGRIRSYFGSSFSFRSLNLEKYGHGIPPIRKKMQQPGDSK